MIQLPVLPRETEYLPRPVRSGEPLRAATGGARLPINRTGDHWAVEIALPDLDAECGRALIADLLLAGGQTVRAYLPQSEIDTGAPGSPRVKGASQFGDTLETDGFTPHFAVRKGWWVNVITGGRLRLHFTQAEVVADAAGEAALSLWPPLRAPADNDLVVITDPCIEGILDSGGEHGAGLLPTLSIRSFVIEELD